MPKFLDLSGVGNSGKSAVVDLLKEVDEICVSDTTFEFDILRVPFGLLELRHALVTNWSPIRSNQAIKNFRSLIKSMGLNPSNHDFYGLIHSSSQRYDAYFGNQFTEKFNAFCDSFIVGKYKAMWPYDSLYQNPYIRFLHKILFRLGFDKLSLREINLVSGLKFDEKTNDLIQSVFELKTQSDTKWITLNNAFEPYNPLPFFQMFPEAKQIVILRDPRDIYVSGKDPKKTKGADKKLLTSYHNKTSFSFLASDNLEIFVKRYKLYRENVLQNSNNTILHINFEDICVNYEDTIKRIFDFLEISPSNHKRKMLFFNPEKSIKNVGLWKSYSDKDEISYIEKFLSDYLYPKKNSNENIL